MTNPYPPEYAELLRPDGRWWLAWLPRTEVLRQLRALWSYLLRMEKKMASDRDLLAVIASGLAALGPAVDSLIADRDSWKTRALTAEGAAAADEADDTAAAEPIKAALDALTGKLAPHRNTSDVPPVEQVPADVASVDQPGTDGETGGDAA